MSALDEMFEKVKKANKALKKYYSPANNGTVYNIAYNLTRQEYTTPALDELNDLRKIRALANIVIEGYRLFGYVSEADMNKLDEALSEAYK